MKERENVPNQPDKFATDGLTLKEDKELAGLLSKWNGGKISTPVFTEIARIIPQPIVEVVVFRKNNETLETLLIPRPEDDIVWPGMFHTPGTALRTSDFKRKDETPLNGPFERIQRNELGNDFAFNPIFVERIYRMCERGPEVAEIYFTELPEVSDNGRYTWYPVDKLAENQKFIQHQLGHVNLAAEQYRKR